MSEFNNVTITREANVYFEGKVTSRAVTFEDGTTKTLGIMLPGDYTFNTDAPELMEILAGELRYRLVSEADWHDIVGGEAFNVPGNSAFDLEIASVVDYCCSYLAD